VTRAEVVEASGKEELAARSADLAQACRRS
jgi:hypothetical protein